MAYKGYINPEVAKMYGIPYSQLTAEQRKILHADSVRRAKLIKERQEAVLRNNLKAFDDEAKMERVLASIYKDCQKQILAEVTETIAKVKKAGGDWSYANQSALTRSRGLFEQITAELTKLGQKEQILFTQGLSNIYTDQYLRQIYELGQSITVKANFNRLNPALVRKTLDYPWSGAMFSDRLWNDKETLGKNLRVGLTQSMILGEGIPEITDRIGKNMETSRYNAERIARTETKRVTYCAHNDSYEDMGVEELEYHTAGERSSSVVCSTCHADRGKIYKRGTEPTLPRHPNCKCVYIPVVSDEFGDNELNELTGSVRGAENYEKWKETYEEAINPDGSYKDGWGMDFTDGKTKYTTADGRKLTLEDYKKEKANPLTTPPKTDKVNIPEVSPTGEVYTGELGKTIRSSFDNGNTIKGYSYGWGDREEKKLQELYEQRKLLTDPAHIKQVDTIIKNHEEYKQLLNTKGVLVEVEKAGTYKLKVPPSQSVDEYVRNSTYYNKYALVETHYTKYNYDVYEERLGGKYYITMKGVSSKKEKEEIYAMADKVFSQNTRAVGSKLRIDTVECNKHSTRSGTVLGFYTPSQHKLTVRTFKSYADIYGVDIQGGKDKFAGTLAHEFAHIIHSKDIRLKDVVATADQWQKWKDLVEPYYEQYRVNKIVDVGSAWSRMKYPINAEDHYRGGGKDHYYQEMWAECTAIIQEDVPEATKAEQLANLRKYFPKVEEFIRAFYAGGV